MHTLDLEWNIFHMACCHNSVLFGAVLFENINELQGLISSKTCCN